MTANGGARGNSAFLLLISALAASALAVAADRVLSPNAREMSHPYLKASHEAAYAKAAVRFADALVREDFPAAHAMLSPGLRSQLSVAALQDRYEEMIGYGEYGRPTRTQLITTMEDWPDRKPHDIGWAYVSIEGPDLIEAVTVILEQAGDAPTIGEIAMWGRP